MSTEPVREPGGILWTDLTVQNADEIRDFYASVVGWLPTPVAMGGYSDYQMNLPASGQPAAGICYARGQNANLPAQWLIYISVTDIDHSIEQCIARGGKVVVPLRSMGQYGRLCVIQDPAGAVAALLQPPA